jgi:hypothetical protein
MSCTKLSDDFHAAHEPPVAQPWVECKIMKVVILNQYDRSSLLHEF